MGKHKMRTGEQSTRRLDAGILAESSFWRLARLSSNNLLVFCKLRPSNCKRKQNWYEFNVRCMVDVKSPSGDGTNRHVFAMK
jgi:hypothetical protein